MAEYGDTILEIRSLKTYFRTDQGIARAVDDVSLAVHAGKTLAVVGESGCGKSVTALSVLRLIPSPPGEHPGGSILFEGLDILQLPEKAMRRLRGNNISMIFQEPMTSMNPVFRVGNQIAATIRLHRKLGWEEARQEAIHMLKRVGIPAPEERLDDYPHQLSGGMLQRVMIAMALASAPKILIADEPTTALDVTIQAQILELLNKLRAETGMGMMLITHDLGVVAETADEVAVMYAGKVVEQAEVNALFKSPRHPYTQGLFASLPGVNYESDRLQTIKGQVPAATEFPEGCRFHPRCPHAMPVCKKEPDLIRVGNEHRVACWLFDPEVMATRTPASDKKNEGWEESPDAE